MRAVISGLVGLSLLVGFATAVDAAPRAKKYRYYVPQGSQGYNSGSAERGGNGYYERLADKLPFGSSIWWEQMMRERRGGRPG